MIEWIKGNMDTITDWLGGAMPWLIAIAIIIVGSLIAKLLEKLVKKGLDKVTFDDKLAKLLGKDVDGCEKGFAKFVYWFAMLCVVYFAVIVTGKEAAIKPIEDIIRDITSFIPGLLAAGLIGFVAWILATVLRNVVEGLIGAAKVDERLDLSEKQPIKSSLGLITFFGVILMMLPVALDALNMDAISKPIGGMISDIFGYIPNVFAGLVVFALGYLIASIVYKVLSNVLESIGTDSVPERLGYTGGSLIAGKSLSQLISTVAMATILVIVSATAIDLMKIEFISKLAQNFVPKYLDILGGLVLLCVGIFLANIVGQIIEPKSALWAKIARIAIMVFLGAAALQKANLSTLTNETFQFIITAAIVAVAFAAGVGGSIAIGLRGRDGVDEFFKKK